MNIAKFVGVIGVISVGLYLLDMYLIDLSMSAAAAIYFVFLIGVSLVLRGDS